MMIYIVPILLFCLILHSRVTGIFSGCGEGWIGVTCNTKCPVNTYAEGDASTPTAAACTNCPANSFSVGGSGSCQCNDGFSQAGSGSSLICTQCGVLTFSCPSGYTYKAETGSCYKGVSTAATYDNAKLACNSDYKGYLVTISSVTENKVVKDLIGNGYEIWIGLNDIVTEGQFKWLHGSSSFTLWGWGQPDNWAGAENCVHLWANDISWNDATCGTTIKYVCEADPISVCSTASLPVCSWGSMPPVTSNMVGYYDVDSWDGSRWNDMSGSNNHVTAVTGVVTLKSFSDNNAPLASSGAALTGTTTTTLTWPAAILPSTYTLFHLTKYEGTSNRNRIVSSTTNWLSGHHRSSPFELGVAHHNSWISSNSISNVLSTQENEWVLSTDQNQKYRFQGTDKTFATSFSSTTNANLGINKFSNENSDWAAALVLVYSRTLTIDEIIQVEGWIYSRFFNHPGALVLKAPTLQYTCGYNNERYAMEWFGPLSGTTGKVFNSVTTDASGTNLVAASEGSNAQSGTYCTIMYRLINSVLPTSCINHLLSVLYIYYIRSFFGYNNWATYFYRYEIYNY